MRLRALLRLLRIRRPGWFTAETEARLTACYMVQRLDVVMSVSATVVDILEV